jgi:hypothetical protein
MLEPGATMDAAERAKLESMSYAIVADQVEGLAD